MLNIFPLKLPIIDKAAPKVTNENPTGPNNVFAISAKGFLSKLGSVFPKIP